MKAKVLSFTQSLILAIGLILIASQVTVFAQSATGGIRGLVTDESGAVLAGAEIKLKGVDTGAEASTTTSSDGLFRLPALTPGLYNVTVVAAGFKRGEYTSVAIKLGTDITLNVTLQPGGADEIVEVSASDNVVLQRDVSQLSTNFESRKITDLPINTAGGGVDSIAYLTPGVVNPADAGFTNTNGGGGISSNGGRSRSNNFSIDGQDNNDISVAGPSFFVDNADLVQEFQIITNNFSAEYGQSSGAVVNIVSKGGTNEFHGTLSYFFRDRKNLDSLTNIERRQGLKDPPARVTNTFGATFGGPIVKDKLLFFASYQGIRQTESSLQQSTASGLTPTPAGLQTLLGIADSNIAGVIRAAAPFNISNGNPTIRPDVATRFIPVTVNGRTAQVEFGAISRLVGQPFEENFGSIRLDWNKSEKLRIFGRYFYSKQESANATGNFQNGFFGDVPSRTQQAGGTIVYQISPNAVNETRINYSRIRVFFGGGGNSTIPSASDAGSAVAFFNLPAGFLDWGVATNLPQGRINDNYQVLNNFSYIAGKHSLKMGLDMKRRLTDSFFLPLQNGQFNFSNFNNFSSNVVASGNVAFGENVVNFPEFDQFYYFQDDWRIRENLTLNLGVRYENSGQPINVLNDITRERESNPETALFRLDVPLEDRIVRRIETDKNNFAPRLGFAYSPRFWKKIFGDSNTVFRGGYGIAYDLAFYNILLNVQTSTPTVFLVSVPGGAGVVPADPTGTSVRGALQRLAPLRTLDPRLLNRTDVAPNFHAPYTQQYSFGMQRQFGTKTIAEVRYVGTTSIGQFQSINANPRIDAIARDFPGFLPSGVRPSPNGRLIAGNGLLRTRFNGATSTYHSLQTRFDTQAVKDLNLGVSYTYSKQLDNASEIFGTFAGGSTIAFAQDPFNVNVGEKSFGAFDFRHVLALNFLYDIPLFREQRGVVGKLLGGFQISGTYQALPGQRYTPTQFFFGSPYNDASFMAAFSGAAESLRPFYGNRNAPVGTVAIDQETATNIFGFTSTSPTGFFLLNAFNQNGAEVPVSVNDVRFIANTGATARMFGSPYGNVARNSEKGDRTSVGNFAIFKTTNVTERMKLQFRAEFFNVFNTPNRGVPDPLIDDAGTTFADINENNGGRRTIQFGLKLIF